MPSTIATPVAESAATPRAPEFRHFAAEWWELHTAHLAPNTITDYTWRLDRHLLPWFGEMEINGITSRDVDEYKASKLRDGRLGARSINMTLSLLCTMLDEGIEQGWMLTNPARGRRRRLPTRPPRRTYLETAEQIQALLEAAHQIDCEIPASRGTVHRRAIIATLVFSGLRIGELCALRWSDIDLEGKWISIRVSKTPAGVRQIRMRPALQLELERLLEQHGMVSPELPVFATATGNEPRPTNLRVRVVQRAAALAAAKLTSFPDGITPHSLRRTFASVLFAIGEPHPVVMVEMGHTNPGMTLGVYAQAMRRDERERTALTELVAGRVTSRTEELNDR